MNFYCKITMVWIFSQSYNIFKKRDSHFELALEGKTITHNHFA